MKANYGEECRMAVGNLNKSKILSPGTIELMKKFSLNRIKPIYSREGIQNTNNNSNGILVYNMNYTTQGKFIGITEAFKPLGCPQKPFLGLYKHPKRFKEALNC